MRILMLKDYFYPEQCAGISLAQDLVKEFSENNHFVEVFTPIPCRGITSDIRTKYRNKKNESHGNATIHRYWLPYEKSSVLSRALRYFLQNIIQVWKGLRCSYDVILLGSTPPTMGLVGTILKKIKKKPFVYNLQDIFPDSLVTGNITHKGSVIWKIGSIVEKITYKNADHIIVISESFKRNLLNKGVPEEKITVVSNWIDIDEIYPVKKENNRLYEEFSISRDKFLVVYAGNFGAAQGANIILKSAEQLKNYCDIQFVIFGGGAEFATAKKIVADHELSNVIIHDLLPSERVSEVYSLGDIALITCKKGVGKAGMPSKTWSIMACNTPIVASFDTESELNLIVSAAKAGICIEPENSEKLSEAILEYKTKSYTNVGRARDYVIEHASRDVCARQYKDILEQQCIK